MMKTLIATAGAIVMLMGGSGCTTDGTERGGAAGIVTVLYVRPENFTDFRLQGRDVRSSTLLFTREVTQTLEPMMRRSISRRPTDLAVYQHRSRRPRYAGSEISESCSNANAGPTLV
jgi:hypothetical protein